MAALAREWRTRIIRREMTGFTVQGRVNSQQGKVGCAMLLDHFERIAPIGRRVAIGAGCAQLPLMNIGVALIAGAGSQLERQIRMASPTICVDMRPVQGKSSFGMIKIRRIFHLPTVHGVTIEAIAIKIRAVRRLLRDQLGHCSQHQQRYHREEPKAFFPEKISWGHGKIQ